MVSAVDDIQQTAEKTLNFSIAQPVDDPPVVAWVSPADGAVVAQDVLSAVELLISATDDSALSAVQITVDGQTVTATALGNNQYAVQFTPAAFGSYIATASATDDNDQTTDVAITFEIKENTVTDCGDIPAWDPDYEYPSGGGAEVNYEGAIYISKWWTKGDVPGADQWGPWEYVSDCDAKKAQRIQSLNAIIGVYPNPADDFIQIRLADDVQIDHVYFYDLKGKQLLHKTLKAASGTQRIDISALAKGQYILKIVADQLTFQQQIIKQ